MTTKRVPYHKKPEDMSIEQWQVELRKQFAFDQDYEIENTGDHPVFSDFTVYNNEKNTSYKVAIRHQETGSHFCSCPDFAVNQLGTCKHIEYVLHILRSSPVTSEYFNIQVELPYSSVSLHYGKERKVYLRTGTRAAEEMKELASEYFDPDGYLLPQALITVNNFFEEAVKLDPEFRVYPDAAEFIYELQESNRRQEHVDNLFPSGIESPLFENLIQADLYPYQREGVIFGAKAGRFLLADEMGLGKTIQAIATAELFINEFSVERILIVCPTSLKYQWKAEIEKFTSRDVIIVEGSYAKRSPLYASSGEYFIISYGIVGNDLDIINNSRFDMVILDEAQRIKNWKTKTAKSIKQIKTPYSAVLTGTPIENRIEEIHSIVEFIDMHKLGPLYRFLYTHQLYDDNGKVIGYQGLRSISESLRDVLLRRTKWEIRDQLPDRIDKTYFVNMTRRQWEMHDHYHSTVTMLVTLWRKRGTLSREDRERLLISLNCMRMSCDSTYILDQATRHDTKIDELNKILEDVLENEDEKVVIFSQWQRMAELARIELERSDISYRFLHGGVTAKKRKHLINEFTDDPAVRVFLSTDAGGVGLNLQKASTIINLDIPWNPAVLEQRIARIYRLGQEKKVRVINLVSRGTIEHRILYLLDFKKSVFKGVLEDGDDTVLMSDTDAKGFMESVEDLVEVSSKDIYMTPHADVDNDEQHDYEQAQAITKKTRNNTVTRTVKRLKNIIQGLFKNY